MDKKNTLYSEEKGFLQFLEYRHLTTIGDGNCWYRTLSLFFDKTEENYKNYRKTISEQIKLNKEKLRPFFINQENSHEDEVLEHLDFDTYCEYVSHNYFYAGNIEILLSSQIFQINI